MKEYIHADFLRQNMKHPFWAWLTYGEHNRTRKYLNILRHVEYYKNKDKKPWDHLFYAFYFLIYRRYSLKSNIFIMPNTTGKGLFLPHPGFCRISSYCRIGENCTILPMVFFGLKTPDAERKITVGNNCYFGTGCTILGPVNIGDNVTIGAGAVVTKDIPTNSVVAGIPARIMKTKDI